MRTSRKIGIGILFLLMSLCVLPAFSQRSKSSLVGKTICLDAGHGGTALTDSYRVGPGGEREEWINLRVALLLQQMLEEKGAKVLMTRLTDENVPFDTRVQLATAHKADVFISVHHNATADPKVNFPIVYYHGYASENKGSVRLGRLLAEQLSKQLYQEKPKATLVSDHAIFPTAGAKVLRDTYGIPGVIAEASFFTNPAEEGRLKQQEHNRQEAMAYVAALEAFFSKSEAPIAAKNSKVTLPPFKVFQEAERVNETAQLWYQDYLRGCELMKQKDMATLQQAYDLFTRSVRSFPDSYVAVACHRNRAMLLRKMGKQAEARQEKKRAKEFYVPLS
ncbi:MAG: N-acetylmuramoyl-L-alanine amidase [Hymenobacteraceae bacterium]|nr:N-acetylmuramoyl-L-alanine amidase [Hymenobacteraceae bacterium]